MEHPEGLNQEFDRKEQAYFANDKLPDEERIGDLVFETNIKKLEATENVSFFDKGKALEDIQSELGLAGWIRRGPFVPDLRSAPVEVLIEHLRDPHYKIIIQGDPPKTVAYFVAPSAINNRESPAAN
jgi:hypothetical protein